MSQAEKISGGQNAAGKGGRPVLAFVMGDPCGVGPELMAKALAEGEVATLARVLVIGDRRVLAEGERVAGVELDLPIVSRIEDLEAGWQGPVFLDRADLDPSEVERGKASAAGGRSALGNFAMALDLHKQGLVDSLTFVPFNKEALRLGGNTFEDEMHFAIDRLGYKGEVAEYNVMDQLWNARVTSHVPLRAVADLITEERILTRLELTFETMRKAGVTSPRIAVAALNPHAGDGGNFGREDLDILAPAVEKAQKRQMRVEGPFPSDTVFLRARDGQFDAVMTMYHDQGQIALKLMGFDRGVTVLGGFPLPITTPAHGTAYDIAGKGVANLEPTRRALRMACAMASVG